MKTKRIKHLIETIDLLDENIRQLREEGEGTADERDLAERWQILKSDHEVELYQLQNS